MLSESAQLALWTFLVIGALIAGVLRWRKLTQDTSKQIKRDMEAKRRPLTKIEIARKRAANRAAKNKGKKK